MTELLKWASQHLGPAWRNTFPFLVIAGCLYFVYANPSQSQQFQATTLSRLTEVEAQLLECREADYAQAQVLIEQGQMLAALKSQLLMLQVTEDSWPFPAWFKDSTGRVLFANAAYEEKYLKPRGYTLDDYVTHDDFAVWPAELAEAFRENDAAVMRTRQYKVFRERIEVEPGVFERQLFVKYPRTLGNTVVGVAGRFLPEMETSD